ncbi:MAG: hypothetical protein RBT51_00535 [Ectothiorhodospiraceae bacterium]|jgi:hypothetical protein|nr:hypothetical protein [Ectothiorhodospiraceae bacterium]
MPQANRQPLLGQAFNDVLTELHAHVFTGVPGESDPFVLSMLDREYMAYVLACYYQCEHCQQHHARAIERERRKQDVPAWDWQKELVRATLFLRTSRSEVSEIEWNEWMQAWRSFARRINHRHPNAACYIAYAIGIARNDHVLMDLAFESINGLVPDDDALKGVIRDIDRVVIFMKAATSKNRTDPVIIRHLDSRAINGA